MMIERPLRSAEEIASTAGTRFPALLPPDARMFAQRAVRLRALAPGHAAGAYLAFAASVADVQQRLLDAGRTDPVSSPLPASADGVAPALQAAARVPDPAWRDLLRRLLAELAPTLNAPARSVAERLLQAPEARLDTQAARLLDGVAFGLDTATAPFIGAALQLQYARLALAFDAQAYRPAEAPTLCPCCGSPPTASVVRIGAETAGLRYLACALCGMQWHMVRITCTHCRSTKGISYHKLLRGDDDARAAVQAEACDACRHYTKICYMDRDPLVDPYADDLASLPLDLLMGEAGYTRWGVNFMLLHGDADGADSPPATETLQ